MMRSNLIYLALGALVVLVGVLGYSLYQEKKQPDGVRLSIGSKGVTIEKK